MFPALFSQYCAMDGDTQRATQVLSSERTHTLKEVPKRGHEYTRGGAGQGRR
jgi:hypothetical protein